MMACALEGPMPLRVCRVAESAVLILIKSAAIAPVAKKPLITKAKIRMLLPFRHFINGKHRG